MSNMKIIQNLFSLEGKTGIVTGATKGIGYEIAKLLSDAGAKVYSFSRNNQLPHHMKPIENVIYKKVDITDYKKVDNQIKEIIEIEDKLDFLVNNAGITLKKRTEDFTNEEWHKIHQVNIDAVFHLCQLCYPYLKDSKTRGRIINITSMAAHLGFSGVTPYCSSKSAVLGLTRALSVEWAKDNILVNSIAPGWIHTDMTEAVKDEERMKKILGRMTLHEFGKAEDIANMVLFLTSKASSYITGQDFAVDGGALSYGY